MSRNQAELDRLHDAIVDLAVRETSDIENATIALFTALADHLELCPPPPGQTQVEFATEWIDVFRANMIHRLSGTIN